MRILAIDTSASPGIAVIDVKNRKPTLVYCDAAITDTKMTDAQRYTTANAFVTYTIYRFGPFDRVCRESFTKGGSKRATQLVFGGWCAVDLALGEFGYIIKESEELTPGTVKKAMTGRGTAPKTRKQAENEFSKGKTKTLQKSVEDGVRELLALDENYEFPNNKGGDSSDACAIGLAYLKKIGEIT